MLMATYTTPLRAIIEQPTQHRNDLTLDQRIEVGRAILFDFDYTMFDSRYKRVFETNFINNFYDREIGFETEHLFKRRLQNWLRINMPYYSNLLESETLKFDPFINSEMNVTHKKTNDETSKSDKNFGETTSKDVTDSTVTDEDTTKITDIAEDENTTSDTTSNIKGDTSGESQGSTKTDSDSDTTTSSDTTQDNENFKRDIHTDTPDTRLAITTNDGSGTVGYASTIDESKENGKQTSKTTGSENTQTGSTTTTNDSTSTQSNQDETSNTLGTEKKQTDINEIGTRDETIDRIISDMGKRDFDEVTDGSINSVEDFVQHRYGKIGVQTYSKMLMEYRQTFLRIEKEIFDEMNQLFMLVY